MLSPNIDPEKILDKTENFPYLFEQGFNTAKKNASKLPNIDISKLNAIVVAGMGGSAIAADVMKSLLEPSLKIPFIVYRNYGLPAFVNDQSLVILSSYSGNTEETLSAFHVAQQRKAKTIAITSGGDLAAQCQDYIPLETGYQPRVAFPFGFASLLALLSRYNLAGQLPTLVESAAAFLVDKVNSQWGSHISIESNPARQLATFCSNRLVTIIGSPYTNACAFRFKAQLNENAKHPAYHQEIPEMNHNEILGWEAAEAIPNPALVMFSDLEDHHRVKARFEFTESILTNRGFKAKHIVIEGPNLLARILGLILLGDLASIYLAYNKMINPAEIESIKLIKHHLTNLLDS